MKYKDIVTADNDGKVFLCKLKDGRELKLQVHDNCESLNKPKYVLYNYDDVDDLTEYLNEDIEEVLELFEPEPEDGDIKFSLIKKYLIDTDVYQYSTKDELKEILKFLNHPIISGAAWKGDGRFLQALPNEYGVVFYWCEYDDYSCYGDGLTHYVKIIDGVKKV